MIQDCLRIFKQNLDPADRLILDNYIPKDGTYLMITMENDVFTCDQPIDIRYNKKTGILEGSTESNYRYLRQLDYYSKLVEMNKPIDRKKIIHSNNYFAFFVKKESLANGKVTNEIIDGYFRVLLNPTIKYEKNVNSREIYQLIEKEIGLPDPNIIEKIQSWINENLLDLPIDTSKKDYLKIFFVLADENETLALYKKESKRYLVPNIYNNNDANKMINGVLYGLPNDNMNMNSKKPYLEHKSRKIKEPSLLTLEEFLIQGKFFDYLMGNASIGKVNVYVDLKEEKISFFKTGEFDKNFNSGLYLRLQKGKEVEIHSVDQITQYRYVLEPRFEMKEIIEIKDTYKKNFEPGYEPKEDLSMMQHLINDVFFGKSLINNYFTDPGELSINDGVVKNSLLTARERLFNWFYKGAEIGISELLEKISIELIKNSINNQYFIKAKHQLNLRWSLMDYFSNNNNMEERMSQMRDYLRGHINTKEEWEFVNDDEYYYAVGQLVNHYLSLVKGQRVNASFVNPFLNAKGDEVIKRRLRYLYKKVNYAIEKKDVRLNRLISHVMLYKPDTRFNVKQDILIGGFTDSSLIYEKNREDI